MSERTAFTVVTGFSIILILLPLPWHWTARNYSTLIYIGWTFVGCVIYFANSIVWRGNLENPAPVWCDISSKISVGLSIALPAVSLCINRRLYNISTMKYASMSPHQKRHQTLIDFSIGVGIPFLVMILHYIVQGHRYDIIEDVGCFPTTYPTAPAIPLVFMWAPLLGIVSMVFSVLTILAFIKKRRTFNTVLNSNNSSLNRSRYFRLMALAATDLLLDIPLGIFILWSNVNGGLQPWISWSNVHYGFSYVNYTPISTLKAVPGAWPALAITRWALPMSAIIFFLFFGLAGESLAFYSKIVQHCFKRFRGTSLTLPLMSTNPTSSGSQPSIVARGVHIKIERTLDLDVDIESTRSMKISDYATLHSASSQKTVHVAFPDLESGANDNDSIATRHPDYFHFPSPPPSPPSNPSNH